MRKTLRSIGKTCTLVLALASSMPSLQGCSRLGQKLQEIDETKQITEELERNYLSPREALSPDIITAAQNYIPGNNPSKIELILIGKMYADTGKTRFNKDANEMWQSLDERRKEAIIRTWTEYAERLKH